MLVHVQLYPYDYAKAPPPAEPFAPPQGDPRPQAPLWGRPRPPAPPACRGASGGAPARGEAALKPGKSQQQGGPMAY